MTELPSDLNDAIAQSRIATAAPSGRQNSTASRIWSFPEIALQAQSITEQFLPEFEEIYPGVKVFFPDTGAWPRPPQLGKTPFKITDLGSSRTPVEDKIAPEDELFLLVNPAAVEVAKSKNST